jgi:hypothetical protein
MSKINGLVMNHKAMNAFSGEFDGDMTIDQILELIEDGDVNQACILLNVEINKPEVADDDSWNPLNTPEDIPEIGEEICISKNVMLTKPDYIADEMPSWENDSAEFNPISILFGEQD